MLLCHSTLPISIMFYYREGIKSFCHLILPISVIFYYREGGNRVILSLNFTHIHYAVFIASLTIIYGPVIKCHFGGGG